MQKKIRPIAVKRSRRALPKSGIVSPLPPADPVIGSDWASSQPFSGHESHPTYNLLVTVQSPVGLHLRPAAILAKLAGRFDCSIFLHHEGREANARSLLSVVMLQAGPGAQIAVAAQGPDAQSAVASLGALFATDFGETADSGAGCASAVL